MIQKGRALWKQLLSDRLFRSTSWFVVAAIVGGCSNYGLQIFLGRFLSTSQFGFFNALLGMYVVLGVPVTTLSMLVSRKTAAYRASRPLSVTAAFFRTFSKQVLIAGLLGLVVFTLCLRPLGNFLNAPTLLPVFFLGLCIFASLMTPVPLSVLQGLQLNSWFAFLQAIEGPTRFMLCTLAALLGFGVQGVMLALFLALVTLWLTAYTVAKKQVGPVPAEMSTENTLAWKDALPVFIANFAFVVITQADLLLVNRFFDPHDVSMYASSVVLGRIVVYVPGALVMAMFPMVSENKALNVSSHPLLLKSLGMTLVCSGVGAFFFTLFSQQSMTFLYGAKYAEAAVLLKFYGWAMLPMALVIVLLQYLIGHGDSLYGSVLLAVAAIEVFLLYWLHTTLMSVIFIVGGTGLVLFVAGFVIAWTHRPSPVVRSHDIVSSLGA